MVMWYSKKELVVPIIATSRGTGIAQPTDFRFWAASQRTYIMKIGQCQGAYMKLKDNYCPNGIENCTNSNALSFYEISARSVG